jgi:hypothetical protein
MSQRYAHGQEVEVRWDRSWVRGTIERCWSDGADVTVGQLGCWYFQWQLIRTVA